MEGEIISQFALYAHEALKNVFDIKIFKNMKQDDIDFAIFDVSSEARYMSILVVRLTRNTSITAGTPQYAQSREFVKLTKQSQELLLFH